ncbi:MAG: hypothetical protein R2754_08485 [Microthrixaceae bacterium]
MKRLRAARGMAAAVAVATLAVGIAGMVQATAKPVPYGQQPIGNWRVNGRVLATEIIGDTVYVGGLFTSVTGPGGSVSRQHLAAFDATTGELRTGFVANADQPVRALTTDGTHLFVGGSFQQIGGVTRHRVASLNPTSGAVDVGFTASTTSHVYSLAAASGRLYVGGVFGNLSGQPIARLGAVSTTSGVAISGFAPTPNAAVTGLDVTDDGEVLAAGQFTTIAGTDRRYVTGLNADGLATGPSYEDAVDYSVWQVAHDPLTDNVFVAVGGYGNQLAALDHQTGEKLWRHRVDGDVQTVAVDDGTAYFGFHEGYQGDPELKLMAADTTTGDLEGAWRLNVTGWMGGFAVAANGNTLAVGGDLNWVNGTNVGGMAILPRTAPPPPTTTTTISTTTTTTTAPPPPGGPLVPAGSEWAYRMSDAPTGWHSPSFDDGAWARGQAELGYGDGDETTVVAPPANTAYFRRSFNLAAVPTEPLRLSVLADDGALLRLNGTEVLRDNLPGGTVGPATNATSYKWGAAETDWVTVAVDPAILAVGANTLSAEVHQAPGSGDLSFDASLEPEGGVTFPAGDVGLVAAGAAWSARTGSAPDGWSNAGFDDSGWATGNAQLGYGDGDEVTVVGPAAPTAYFRTEFQLDALPQRPLRLSVLADDGSLVRLNGTELARENLPAGSVGPNTPASTYKWGAAESTWVSVTVPPSALVVGTNALAVEVHQAPGSGDLSFDASLSVPA